MAVPLLFLTPQLQRKGFLGSDIFFPLWRKVQPYHISNSYGLFRCTTGERKHLNSSPPNGSWGWADLSPSVVLRPEIIFEGIFANASRQLEEEEQAQWKEIKFR